MNKKIIAILVSLPLSSAVFADDMPTIHNTTVQPGPNQPPSSDKLPDHSSLKPSGTSSGNQSVTFDPSTIFNEPGQVTKPEFLNHIALQKIKILNATFNQMSPGEEGYTKLQQEIELYRDFVNDSEISVNSMAEVFNLALTSIKPAIENNTLSSHEAEEIKLTLDVLLNSSLNAKVKAGLEISLRAAQLLPSGINYAKLETLAMKSATFQLNKLSSIGEVQKAIVYAAREVAIIEAELKSAIAMDNINAIKSAQAELTNAQNKFNSAIANSPLENMKADILQLATIEEYNNKITDLKTALENYKIYLGENSVFQPSVLTDLSNKINALEPASYATNSSQLPNDSQLINLETQFKKLPYAVLAENPNLHQLFANNNTAALNQIREEFNIPEDEFNTTIRTKAALAAYNQQLKQLKDYNEELNDYLQKISSPQSTAHSQLQTDLEKLTDVSLDNPKNLSADQLLTNLGNLESSFKKLPYAVYIENPNLAELYTEQKNLKNVKASDIVDSTIPYGLGDIDVLTLNEYDKSITAYLDDPKNTELPGDVLDALGIPPHLASFENQVKARAKEIKSILQNPKAQQIIQSYQQATTKTNAVEKEYNITEADMESFRLQAQIYQYNQQINDVITSPKLTVLETTPKDDPLINVVDTYSNARASLVSIQSQLPQSINPDPSNAVAAKTLIYELDQVKAYNTQLSELSTEFWNLSSNAPQSRLAKIFQYFKDNWTEKFTQKFNPNAPKSFRQKITDLNTNLNLVARQLEIATVVQEANLTQSRIAAATTLTPGTQAQIILDNAEELMKVIKPILSTMENDSQLSSQTEKLLKNVNTLVDAINYYQDPPVNVTVTPSGSLSDVVITMNQTFDTLTALDDLPQTVLTDAQKVQIDAVKQNIKYYNGAAEPNSYYSRSSGGSTNGGGVDPTVPTNPDNPTNIHGGYDGGGYHGGNDPINGGGRDPTIDPFEE